MESMVSRRESCAIPHDGDVLQVVQLTDTHLCREPGGTLLDMDTDRSLQAVIEQARRERHKIDLVLCTGDLSDRGAITAYQRLQDYFHQFAAEQVWLPGNHDDRSLMETVADSPVRLCPEIRAGTWQILMLDSQVPGEVGGELGEAELAALERALAAAATEGLHSLVCLHHHPLAVGCEWLDEQMIADADQFFSVLDDSSSVRGVLWGHVHQEVDRERNGVRLMASPSTCVQFAPDSKGFCADDAPPGYRWLDLHPDGRIETGVSRVTDVKFEVDLDSGGYLQD